MIKQLNRFTQLAKLLDENSDLYTPSFIYSESIIISILKKIEKLTLESGCHTLFTIKPFSITEGLQLIAKYVYGFSTSSLFEATLAKALLGDQGVIHITSPCFRQGDLDNIFDICDYISFNSITQLNRSIKKINGRTSIGLRVNPKLSFIDDPRYDPCKKHSKLGVSINQLTKELNNNSKILRKINGLHFHNNCDSKDFSQLYATVQHLDKKLNKLFPYLTWINFGGGYLFDEDICFDEFYRAVELVQSKYRFNVFIEPGSSIVRKACFLVSTVEDLIQSDNKIIAILDTTVNHMPEVFEYQYEPDIIGHSDGARYSYILCGSSCLAGDVFGEYCFHEPLSVGSRLVFANVGAYTTVKWNMFNGINLPSIYSINESGEFKLEKQFTYEDFISRNGVENYVY